MRTQAQAITVAGTDSWHPTESMADTSPELKESEDQRCLSSIQARAA